MEPSEFSSTHSNNRFHLEISTSTPEGVKGLSGVFVSGGCTLPTNRAQEACVDPRFSCPGGTFHGSRAASAPGIGGCVETRGSAVPMPAGAPVESSRRDVGSCGHSRPGAESAPANIGRPSGTGGWTPRAQMEMRVRCRLRGRTPNRPRLLKLTPPVPLFLLHPK